MKILPQFSKDMAAAQGTPGALEPGARDAGRSARKHWGSLAKALVSAGLLTWIVTSADLGSVWQALSNIDLAWLGLAAMAQVVGLAVITTRWRGFLTAMGVRLNWFYLYGSVLCSAFVRQFLPSTVGGDAIRAYDAWRKGAPPGVAFTSLLVERLLGLAALALFVIAALVLWGKMAEQIPMVWTWLGLGLAAVAATLFLLFADAPGLFRRLAWLATKVPLGGKMAKIAEALGVNRGKYGQLVRGFAISLVLQVVVVTFYWLMAKSLGLGLDFGAFVLIAPLATFVMMAPISINGIGLREGVLIFLLGLWGVDPAAALALAWVEYGLSLSFGLVGGIVYGLRRS